MLPALRPGRLVVAVGLRRGCRPGDVVIIQHDGMEKIKRIADVGPQGIFVRGDNAAASTDSRRFGWLSAETVKGTVVWPH